MTLLERVRTSLSPDYDVREEIGRGGMGAVFLAVDPTLARSVAVKVLLPEQATARAVERFLREARAMAAVDHPGVVRVHRAGEARGLFYCVMEWVEGRTLEERLRAGPLPAGAVEQLAKDLLSALAAIHRAGIVHRDVKPSNIFLVDGRAVLGDLGVALPSEGGPDRLTAAGEVVGTPAYLAPEQRDGGATAATDVYAAGLVVYEAAVGARLQDRAAADDPWASVPRRLRRPLRKALRPEPDDRWSDAAAFRAGLDGRSRLAPRVAAGILVATAALGVGVLIDAPGPGAPEIGDLAVLPFDVADPSLDPMLGRNLAILSAHALEGLPDLRVIPAARTARRDGAVSPSGRIAATYLAHGSLLRRTGSIEARLAVETADGQRLPERVLSGDSADLVGLADSIALTLVRMVQPRLVASYRGLEERSTGSLPAMRAFLLGEHAFHHNAWASAEAHYREALALDSDFALAEWRLWNAWRWRLTGREVVDLERLQQDHGRDLGAVDRALLAAMVRPPGPRRIDALEAVTRRHGYAGYPWLLLGDEVYHRGPLDGRSLEEAGRLFEEAAARNPYLAPTYEHGLLAFTRLGDEARARLFLERLMDTAAPPAPGQVLHFPTLLEQAYLERFHPLEGAGRRDSLFGAHDPARWEALAFAARMGLALDVPAAQLELGRRLVRAPGAPASLRGNGHLAQALALMVLGRPAAALPHIDSATALLEGATGAEVEAAEWRVVLPALGVLELPADEVERGERRLRRAVEDSAVGADRAAWALALKAFAAGDMDAGARWRERIGDDPADTTGMRRLADVAGAVARAEHARALRLSDPLLDDQYLPRDRDPFVRTALHVLRSRAFEGLGDIAGARRERVWSENQDIAYRLDAPELSTRGGLPQTVEVDWVASPYSDRRRARLALTLGNTREGCRLLDRVLRLWSDAEPALQPGRADDRRLHDTACP